VKRTNRIVRVLSVNYFQSPPTQPDRLRKSPSFIGMNWGELVALPLEITLLTGCSEASLLGFANGALGLLPLRSSEPLDTTWPKKSIGRTLNLRLPA